MQSHWNYTHNMYVCCCVCLALCDMCVFQLDFEFLVHTLWEKRVDDEATTMTTTVTATVRLECIAKTKTETETETAHKQAQANAAFAVGVSSNNKKHGSATSTTTAMRASMMLLSWCCSADDDDNVRLFVCPLCTAAQYFGRQCGAALSRVRLLCSALLQQMSRQSTALATLSELLLLAFQISMGSIKCIYNSLKSTKATLESAQLWYTRYTHLFNTYILCCILSWSPFTAIQFSLE